MTQSNFEKPPVSLSKPPVSATRYSVQEGAVVESEVVTSHRPASSGQVPAVLDSRLASVAPAPVTLAKPPFGHSFHKGTLVGMSAVAPPVTKLIVARDEPAVATLPVPTVPFVAPKPVAVEATPTREPSVAPLSVAPATKPSPYARRATQIGIPVSVEVARRQSAAEEASWDLDGSANAEAERKLEEERLAQEAKTREEGEAAKKRRSALDAFLTKIEQSLATAGGFDFAPRVQPLESMVTAAFAGLGRQHQRTLVLKAATVQAMMKECLPDAFAQAAVAAVRAKVGEQLEVHMATLFWGSGISISDVPADVRQRVSDIAEAFGKSLPAPLTAAVDADVVIDAHKATLVYHSKAILDGANVEKIAGFTTLWKQGWVPVGVLKDKSFLIVVKSS